MMTPTRANRAAIAATLLGLLAAIAGTRACEEVPDCVCSPRKYKLTFDLAQDCENTNEIEDLPGIRFASIGPTKWTACNPDLIEVTQVQIIEEGTCGTIVSSDTFFDPPVTSGEIEYTSKSTELQPGVDLADQVDVWDIVPLEIYVRIMGKDASGNDISIIRSPYSNIVYSNECGSGPIVFDDLGLGFVNFVSTILIYFVSSDDT